MNRQLHDTLTIRQTLIEAGRSSFTRKGFEGTTIHDVTKLVDIEERVFFSYFESLDDLLEAIWSES